MPIEKATISVLDRGFIFGDGVYELIPRIPGGRFASRNISPAPASLDAIRLANPHPLRSGRAVGKIIAGNPWRTRTCISRYPGRGQARSRFPEGRQAHVSSWRASSCAVGGAGEAGRQGDRAARLQVAALRHQVDFASGQLHAADARTDEGCVEAIWCATAS